MRGQLLSLVIIALLVGCSPVTATPDNSIDYTPESDMVAIPTDSVPTREGVDNPTAEAGDLGSGSISDDTPLETGSFSAQLDGAETVEVNDTGTINCENGVYVIRPSLSDFPQISLILPRNATVGNFSLQNNLGDGSAASASVFFEDGRVFASGVDGILIIDALATQAGQAVTGSFDFSASSGAQTINARGEFDFIAPDDAVYCS